MVAVLGGLYSTLLRQKISDYLPYLGMGLVTWGYIAAVVNEGCATFIGSAYLIKQLRMPLSIHVCRVVWRNFVIFLHSLPVIIIALFWFGHYPKLEFLLLIPGLLILALQGLWIGIVLGLLCARYRDVVPIVANLLQITFFFTPVMWSPEILKGRAWVAELNPLYHLIQIIRAPVLGTAIELRSWVWSIGLLLVGLAAAQYLMSRCRDRVAYWL
jgi:lipopolysaccharide transport system permease protein